MSSEAHDLRVLSTKLKFVSEDTVLAELCQLMHKAEYTVALLSAFCTHEVFRLVCKSIKPNTEKLLLARFRMSDVAVGACDIAVLEEALNTGFKVFINPAYHGKIYIGDSTAIVGSSNLTSSGLGYKKTANIEQNCLAPYSDALKKRVSSLIESSIQVDGVLLQSMQARIEELKLVPDPMLGKVETKWLIDALDRKLEQSESIEELTSQASFTLGDCLWSSPFLPDEGDGELLAHDRQLLGCPSEFDMAAHLDYIAFALEKSKIIEWLKYTINQQRRSGREGIQFGIVKAALKESIDPHGEYHNELFKLLVSNLFNWIKFVQISSQASLEIVRPANSEVVQAKTQRKE